MFLRTKITLVLFLLPALIFAAAANSGTITIPHTHPLIYYHGRWDVSPGTWWAGSGFKLHVQNLHSLTLNLGPHTTAPEAAVGVSIDYSDFITVNMSAGANVIPLSPSVGNTELKRKESVIRINVQGWQNNRINLESITLNSGAVVLPFTPQKLAFQFIGDSLSAGQYLPQGVDQAWPFLVGEHFKAEHRVNAQPGAALADIVSYGNMHGVSFQFFRTEDTGYYYTSDHNYTTAWNFARDVPQPTHLVIHIGANDASQGVTNDQFVEVYTNFIVRLRQMYKKQPIFVFTPWGWPSADGSISYYYTGLYQQIVNSRISAGDKDIFLVDTTGWVTFDDVFPDNTHPNVDGHQKIAGEFISWLSEWGLKPEKKWETSV